MTGQVTVRAVSRDADPATTTSGDPTFAEPPPGRCYRSVSRILSSRLPSAGARARRSSFIWDLRHRRPRAAYPYCIQDGPSFPPCGGAVLLGLAPRGVCLAATVTRSAGGLLPHHFTHHRIPDEPGRRLVCFLLHLPSVAERNCLPVRKHGALWCSDFPHRSVNGAMIRPITKSDDDASERHILRRFLKQFQIDNDSTGVLARDDSVALSDLDLTLRRHGKTAGGSAIERHYRASVT